MNARQVTLVVPSTVEATITGYTRLEISARKIKGFGFTGEPRRVLALNKSNKHVASMSFLGIAAFLDANCERVGGVA